MLEFRGEIEEKCLKIKKLEFIKLREGGVFFSEVSRKKIKKEEEEYSLRNRVLRETNYCTKNMKKMYILAKSRFLIKPPFYEKISNCEI